ncbi:LSU ribosomal protein L24P [Anseongella ginsenosidimutans]|uniref:Large ribosomal subunit protein uL24 n=1 Tax=Anseongella ginsenosidimutans TaxID=496056 RepID=A0A4R3KMG6_9SPHI|nr:50S ribosomal protein L24 [Anseongella ginsenosidimutans]QEC54049.1 50S ribosomal protein L24 [Anseongella ginsenosidimutans]TCS85186.1 LSU ribosomal protein L24P [Anseongella ginsenosidimutans]
MERKKNKQAKLHLKKGDQVLVITGNDKGKEGKVLEVLSDKQRAYVEGANIVSKHTKPNAKNPNGGIVKQEAAIHISNLMVIDPKSGKASRTGRRLNENGKLERYAKKSGEVIK